jgi:predicted ATPase
MSVESGCWFSKGGPLGGGGSPGQGSTERLFGRDQDLEFLRSFVDQAAVGSGALLLSGEAGVGKTVLLDAVAAHATAAGMRVLRAAGAEFEADLSFAALNQVLYPLLDGLQQLSALHGRALRVALGLSDGSPADQLVVSNAALALLLQAAATRPVLVMVDDLPWVDRASAVVLGFVAPADLPAAGSGSWPPTGQGRRASSNAAACQDMSCSRWMTMPRPP